MRKVIFKEDYNITEFPQHGGRLVEGRKGKVEDVSAQLADVLINDLEKAEAYKEPVKKDEESEGEDDDDDDESEKSKRPSFLSNTPWARDKQQAEN